MASSSLPGAGMQRQGLELALWTKCSAQPLLHITFWSLPTRLPQAQPLPQYMSTWKALLSWSPPSPKESPLDGVPEHDFSNIQSLVRCCGCFQTPPVLLEKMLSCPAGSWAAFGACQWFPQGYPDCRLLCPVLIPANLSSQPYIKPHHAVEEQIRVTNAFQLARKLPGPVSGKSKAESEPR